jgi:hypothetical protein
MPLTLRIDQGFQHLGIANPDDSMTTRIVRMAQEVAVVNDRPMWLVLDAFFAVGPVFECARSVYSTTLKQPYIQVVTRAKKSYVAFFPPPPPTLPRQRGRPREYGDKLTLWEAFDHPDVFQEVEMTVYGQVECVQLMSANLLWRPLGDYIQFIWAITSRGPIVLMCSDLTANPETVLTLYCRRVRIEVLFDTLKNTLGAFRFHFWSQYLPAHSRQPKPNSHIKIPQSQQVDKVKACWRAMEMFVFCAGVAAGLLQCFSLRYQAGLWKQQILYLRTRSRELPSENTVRQILAPLLARHLMQARQKTMGWKIRGALEGDEPPEVHRYG